MLSGPLLIALAFSDDFESGTLRTSDTPPGQWSMLQINRPAVGFAVGDAGAHRGSYGLTVVDLETVGTESSGNYVANAQAPAAPDFYVRYWVRFRANNDAGYVVTLWVLGTASGIISTEVALAEQHLVLHGYHSDGGEVVAPRGAPIALGQWQLVEAFTTGAGTATGERVLKVDGVEVSQSLSDFSGAPTLGFSLGQTYATRAWTGTIDFDDFRADTSPPASTLKLVQLGLPDAGCVELGVELEDSDGVSRPAPYAFSAQLETDGGTVHGSAGCTGAPTVFFDAGVLDVRAWWRPSHAGTFGGSASYVDFVSSPAALVASAAQPRVLTVGCGCGTGTGPPALLLLALLARRRRRKPSAATPSSPNPPAPSHLHPPLVVVPPPPAPPSPPPEPPPMPPSFTTGGSPTVKTHSLQPEAP